MILSILAYYDERASVHSVLPSPAPYGWGDSVLGAPRVLASSSQRLHVFFTTDRYPCISRWEEVRPQRKAKKRRY